MTERDFDRMLEEGLAAMPLPDDVVRRVSPWHQAAKRILVGMALSTVIIEVLWLDYILPYVGLVMMLLGFRALGRENRWFAGGYLCAWVRLVILGFHLILNATIYNGSFAGTTSGILLAMVTHVAAFCQIVSIVYGFRDIQRKAGVEGKPRRGLIAWYSTMLVLGAVEYSGFVIGWSMMIVYFCILRGLYRLSKELEQAGYAAQPRQVKTSDRTVAWCCAGAVCLGILAGYVFFRQYPMDWSAAEENGQTELRQELLELGFPEDVLADISDGDVLRCAGAVRVVADPETGHGMYGNRYLLSANAAPPPEDDLYTRGVAVELENDKWIIFHHFRWADGPRFRGADMIRIDPAYAQNPGWGADSDWSGRVLYDRDGVKYASDYHFLGELTYDSGISFFANPVQTEAFAAFSFPDRGQDCRGYVCYGMELLDAQWSMFSAFYYDWQESAWQYPVRTALERQLGGFSFGDSVFHRASTQFQFFLSELE